MTSWRIPDYVMSIKSSTITNALIGHAITVKLHRRNNRYPIRGMIIINKAHDDSTLWLDAIKSIINVDELLDIEIVSLCEPRNQSDRPLLQSKYVGKRLAGEIIRLYTANSVLTEDVQQILRKTSS